MFVRLAIAADIDEIVEMAHQNMMSTCPHMEFSHEICRSTVERGLETAQPTIWVVEQKREVVAFMSAEMYEYDAAEGFYTLQKVLYVKPEYRGSRAALLLMNNLVSWSQRLGAKEIVGGNDNEFNSERTAMFLEHFGFGKTGFAMRRVL